MLCDLVVRPFQSTDAAPVSALITTTMRESNARDYPPDRLEAFIAYFTPADRVDEHDLEAAGSYEAPFVKSPREK